MSEFKEKLELMKDGIIDAVDNPALISSDLVNEDGEIISHVPEVDEDIQQQSSHPRNERGRRKRRDIKDRLDAVLAENKAKDAQNQQLMAYIQNQERRLSEVQVKADQSAHYSNIYYEHSLENDEQKTLTELKVAKEEGDIEKEIALQQKLADIAAEKKVQQFSKALPKQQPEPANYQNPAYYQEPLYHQPEPPQEFQEQTNEVYEDWLDENPWADPNSPEYDQDLSYEVNELAVELNKNLKFNRSSELIGTPQYYGALTNIMKERYGGSTPNNDNEYVDNHAYEVAPVNKRGSSMADRYVSNRQSPNNHTTRPGMSLTPDEKQIAMGLIPVLSNIYKRQITPEEAIQEYYNQKVNDVQNKRNYY